MEFIMENITRILEIFQLIKSNTQLLSLINFISNKNQN